MNCHFGVTRDFMEPVVAVGTIFAAALSSLSAMSLRASSDRGWGQSVPPPVCHNALREEEGKTFCCVWAPRISMMVEGMAALVTGVFTFTAGTCPGYHTSRGCLLYTSDAADERSSVDLGGRRIIKK